MLNPVQQNLVTHACFVHKTINKLHAVNMCIDTAEDQINKLITEPLSLENRKIIDSLMEISKQYRDIANELRLNKDE